LRKLPDKVTLDFAMRDQGEKKFNK
jgi:hypothetical protein